jgi:hypothetical protein
MRTFFQRKRNVVSSGWVQVILLHGVSRREAQFDFKHNLPKPTVARAAVVLRARAFRAQR